MHTRIMHWPSQNAIKAPVAVTAAVAALAVTWNAFAASPSWTQWAGPNRDFHIDCQKLAEKWPEGGPKQLWKRPLGQGYSAIVVDQGVLYTMHRQGDDEFVTALDAETGSTKWEHRYAAKPHDSQVREFGCGPNATPLLLPDRVVTVGFTGLMQCVSRADGKLLWSHDLLKEFDVKPDNHGYSASPLLYKDTIILPVGGKECGLAAFKPTDGSIVWKSEPVSCGHSSPVLIDAGGGEQLVCGGVEGMVGANPADGKILWRSDAAGVFALTPLWGRDGLLFMGARSAGGGDDGGVGMFRLTGSGGDQKVATVWSSRKARIGYWNAVRVGDCVIASIGDDGRFLAALDARTGEIKWRQRGFRKANSVFADGKLIFIDEDGQLVMAKATPEEFTVLAQAKILESVAWTVPTIVGTKLYARDKKNILALDLASAN